jgi:uncharacterized protein YlxW (UPF0749 family)
MLPLFGGTSLTPELPQESATLPAEPDSVGSPKKATLLTLKKALITPSRAQLGMAVLLALLGFMAVAQVRTNQLDSEYAGAREQDLIDLLSALSGAGERAQSEIARLEQTKAELQNETARQRTALEQAQRDLEAFQILAGVVPVSGPGLIVRIEVPTGESISSTQFLDLVQELRTAGAEAISINEAVRLVAESAITTGSEGLVVDGTPLQAPYEVRVIGDPEVLEGALVFPDGPITKMEQDARATVQIESTDELQITVVHETASD